MQHNFIHSLVDEVVPTLCADVATPRALTVSLLIQYGEWDQLASLQVDPMHYKTAHDYWLDASVTSFLRKWQPLPTSFDRKAVAVENFWRSEQQCCRTNIRLAPLLENCLDDSRDEAVWRVIRQIRKEVSSILGPAPETVYGSDHPWADREIDILDGRHGPGATYGDKGQLTTVADKMSSRPTITAGALGWLFNWSETKWATSVASNITGSTINFVRGNRFTTVPKDCAKDRGIAVEPSINVFYQLALGRVLKARLKRAGLNLPLAKEKHMQVACEASSRGNYATIDLSNASDTVARSLVKLLLPPEWYSLMESLRSPTTVINGQVVYLEKFSSMGNGYTFELETLLFAAISKIATRECGLPAKLGSDVYVFGDDIIVPTDAAQSVIAVLRFLGFTPNVQKTFLSGPFRESCGGDFFLGVDVRPYFQKDELSEPQHYIALANGIRRMAKANAPARWPVSRRSWFRVLDALPSRIRRLRGPEALGDICIHDDPDRWNTRIGNSIRYVRVYKPDPRTQKWVSWSHFKPDVVLAAALYGSGDGRLGLLPRDAVTSYHEDWVPYS